MDGQERLWLAIETGDLREAEQALREGADLHDEDAPPLILAMEAKRPEMVRFLLEAGAPVHHGGFYGKAPLYWAVFQTEEGAGWAPVQREMARLLIAHGARVHGEEGADEGTSLHCAAEQGNAEALRMLLDEAGGRETLSVLDYIERTPLGCAVDGGSVDCARVLVAAGADVNLVGYMVSDHNIGDPALRRAMRRADVSMVRFLLEHGADPDMPGWAWCSARTDVDSISGEVGEELRGMLELPRIEKPWQSPFREEIERQLLADLEFHGGRTRRVRVYWQRSGLGRIVQLRGQPLAGGQGVRLRKAGKEQVGVGDFDFVVLTQEQAFLAFWTRLEAEHGVKYACGRSLPVHVAERLTSRQEFFLSSDARNQKWRRN